MFQSDVFMKNSFQPVMIRLSIGMEWMLTGIKSIRINEVPVLSK